MNIELVAEQHLFKVCNLTYLTNFAGGDQSFIDQMIGLFCKQVPEELNNIRVHASLNNLADVRNVAHKLKSSVSLLGAEPMIAQLKQVEELAISGAENSAILELHDQLLALFVTAEAELKNYLAER